MFYRVSLQLAFVDAANPTKVKDAARLLLSTAVIINKGAINEEKGFILLEKCYHDEDPTKPCEQIGIWTP